MSLADAREARNKKNERNQQRSQVARDTQLQSDSCSNIAQLRIDKCNLQQTIDKLKKSKDKYKRKYERLKKNIDEYKQRASVDAVTLDTCINTIEQECDTSVIYLIIFMNHI